MTPQAMPLMFRSQGRFTVGHGQILNLLEILLDPGVIFRSENAH